MRKPNGRDSGEPADQGGVYAAAIAALVGELATAEKRATAAKRLLGELRAYTGIEPVMTMPAAATMPALGRRKRGRPRVGELLRQIPKAKNQHDVANMPGHIELSPRELARAKAKPRAQARRHAPATATSAATAKADMPRIAEIVSTIAKINERLASAIERKDIPAIKESVSALAHGQRRGGDLLVRLAGRVKSLPVTKADRKAWRRAAALTQQAFDKKVERTIKKTIAAMGAAAPSPAPARSPSPGKPKKPRPREIGPAHVKTKITGWRKDSDGGLSREVIGIAETSSKDIATVPAS